MITLEDLQTTYREQILALAAKHGAENIRVFGSVARGDQGEQSDLDLLYSFTPPNGLWETCGMQVELEELLEVPVDFISEHYLRPEFKPYVLEEAVPL